MFETNTRPTGHTLGKWLSVAGIICLCSFGAVSAGTAHGIDGGPHGDTGTDQADADVADGGDTTKASGCAVVSSRMTGVPTAGALFVLGLLALRTRRDSGERSNV